MHPATTAGMPLSPPLTMHQQPPTPSNTHTYLPLPRFPLPSDTDRVLPQLSFPMHESLRNHFNTPSHRAPHAQQIPFQPHALTQPPHPSPHRPIPPRPDIVHPARAPHPLPHHSPAITHPLYRPANLSPPTQSPAMPLHPQPIQTPVINAHQQPASHTRPVADAANHVPMYTHIASNHIPAMRLFPPRPAPPPPHPHLAEPNASTLSPLQNAKPILPSTTLPAAPPPAPRDAAAEQYWRRLHALLTSANHFAKHLQPDRTTLPCPEEIPRQIACDLQGLPAHAADAHAVKQSQQYRSAYTARAAGDFMEYGVTSAHAVWAASVLAEVIASPSPKGVTDAPITGTCPDRAVEDVRIRLFEAEVSCLPMEYVEELLKKRRAMRKFKHRIDLCVRILLALEGRGRRPAPATLDRVKLQLEKADMQARAEAEREAARKEKERLKIEKLKIEKLKNERLKNERLKNERGKKIGVKTEDHKKRKRQQSAQASFMMRFVKKDEKAEAEAEDEVFVETRKGFAVPIAKDRDVMCVSWWLRAEVKNISWELLEHLLQGQQHEGVTAEQMLQHLSICAKRRGSAERRIHVVLREFRQYRKMHTENRTPMFAARRADIRGRGLTGPVKLLQFAENHRPAFFGTFSRRSKLISGRHPFGKDTELDYECDSADEWDEDEEGEDLLDCEADKELASEEAELRRLYGSDDEEDDDFLDDADLEDDDDNDDGAGDENGNGSARASQEGSIAPKADGNGTDVIDLTLITVNDAKGENKRPAKDETRKRSGKRRKGFLKQSVVMYGVSVPDGEPSALDRFAVSALEGSQPIQMFNPFVYTSSDIVAEHLKAKPPSSRTVRASNMDESTKLDLAAALMKTGSAKDKIVLQFCEHRKLRGLTVPTKAVINRAIGEIAIKEKRNGDTRALWHLTDQTIAKKIAEMKNSTPALFPRPSASMVVD